MARKENSQSLEEKIDSACAVISRYMVEEKDAIEALQILKNEVLENKGLEEIKKLNNALCRLREAISVNYLNFYRKEFDFLAQEWLELIDSKNNTPSKAKLKEIIVKFARLQALYNIILNKSKNILTVYECWWICEHLKIRFDNVERKFWIYCVKNILKKVEDTILEARKHCNPKTEDIAKNIKIIEEIIFFLFKSYKIWFSGDKDLAKEIAAPLKQLDLTCILVSSFYRQLLNPIQAEMKQMVFPLMLCSGLDLEACDRINELTSLSGDILKYNNAGNRREISECIQKLNKTLDSKSIFTGVSTEQRIIIITEVISKLTVKLSIFQGVFFDGFIERHIQDFWLHKSTTVEQYSSIYSCICSPDDKMSGYFKKNPLDQIELLQIMLKRMKEDNCTQSIRSVGLYKKIAENIELLTAARQSTSGSNRYGFVSEISSSSSSVSLSSLSSLSRRNT